MADHDHRRGPDWRETRGRGWRGEDDDTQEAHGYRGEGRSWEPPYGDEATYGRQGQRGGSRMTPGEGGGRYPRGGGSYGQGDYSASARSSSSHDGYRYGDTGQAGQGGFDASREWGAGGRGGYSGYGSSGQGQTGPGGYPRGGYRGSGYGGDYGQDPYGGGEYIRQSGIGQDDKAGRGYEGVCGEGAGRGGYDETKGAGPADDYQAYAGGGGADDRDGRHRGDFDPDYLRWRRGQLDSYDRDYQHWRESQARLHDEDYRRWRDARRKKFHEEFHGWRESRSSGSSIAQSPSAGATSGFAAHQGKAGGDASAVPLGQDVDPAIRNIADGGGGREDLHQQRDTSKDKND